MLANDANDAKKDTRYARNSAGHQLDADPTKFASCDTDSTVSSAERQRPATGDVGAGPAKSRPDEFRSLGGKHAVTCDDGAPALGGSVREIEKADERGEIASIAASSLKDEILERARCRGACEEKGISRLPPRIYSEIEVKPTQLIS
ncbi:hypothetical protein EAI_07056 [Harpegnathos saltator]|uniref:Uncharacterized protein n=1 Tax=Harpegnathos saltator TaxID=610380 RepID=E2BVG0_HARSA|nr:hypothetical protein EAI_07056 [Harpegnathos saltator]